MIFMVQVSFSLAALRQLRVSMLCGTCRRLHMHRRGRCMIPMIQAHPTDRERRMSALCMLRCTAHWQNGKGEART